MRFWLIKARCPRRGERAFICQNNGRIHGIMNAKLKLLTFTFVVAAFFLFFGIVLAYVANESAGVVVGQTGFTGAGSGLTANTLSLPPGVAGAGTTLFILDGNNNRVLAYSPLPTSPNASALFALGQTDLVSNSNGSATSLTMSIPGGIYLDTASAVTTLYVADSNNGRVFIYHNPASMDQGADFEVGQANMTDSGVAGTSQSSLTDGVAGVFADASHLYVADTSESRVLVYNLPIAANGQTATVVLGQSTFTSLASGTAATNLNQPRGVFADASHVYVADTGNNRVLIYNLPIGTGQAAAVGVGQNGFGTGNVSANQGQGGTVAANSVSAPKYVTVDPATNSLVVSDSGNNRVLIYAGIPTANNASATVALGQAALAGAGGGASNEGQGFTPGSNTLSSPLGLWVNNGELWVADNNNSRVLAFDSVVNTPTMTPTLTSIPTATITPTITPTPVNFGGFFGNQNIATSSNGSFLDASTNMAAFQFTAPGGKSVTAVNFTGNVTGTSPVFIVGIQAGFAFDSPSGTF